MSVMATESALLSEMCQSFAELGQSLCLSLGRPNAI